MRIATWNIGSMLGKNEDEIADSIVRGIEKYSIDVLCLQEVLTSGENSGCLTKVKQRLKFGYVEKFELSSAHIANSNSKVGVAILSKLKMGKPSQFHLQNPNLHVTRNGKEIYSDDKGFLIVEITYNDKCIYVANGHMLPYHSFDDDSINHIGDYEKSYKKLHTLCAGKPFIICGDFNTSKLETVLPQIYKDMNNTFSEETRGNGHQNDYLFVSDDFTWEKDRVEYIDGFDHYFCACNVEIIPENVVRILHLSDIHYGMSNPSIDIKTNLVGVSENNVDEAILELELNKVSEKIDYVVVSGDITNGGKSEGFNRFTTLVNKMQSNKKLPPSSRFIIVPGNHDVGDDNRRWDDFIEMFGGSFIRPWFEEHDSSIREIINELQCFLRTSVGELFICGLFKGKTENIKVPFLLDCKKKILIYAFNSSIISKSKIQLGEESQKEIEKIKSKTRLSKEVQKILSILENELIVDPARIDPNELLLFEKITAEISNKVNLATYHKVVVLHHPVSTFATNEEVKKFSELTNAGLCKKQFSDRGIQIIMHGHKHQPGIYHDTTLENERSFLVVSGGTVFGWNASISKSRGFYIHTIFNNDMTSEYLTLDSSKPFKERHKLNGDETIKNGLTLEQIRRTVSTRILNHVNFEINTKGKEIVGWSKLIHDTHVGVIATAYGILILEQLNCDNPYYLSIKDRIIESLWEFRTNVGGWSAVSQVNTMGAPEATCWVLLAFHYAKSSHKYDALKDLCNIYKREREKINSNFTLSLLIITLCEVDPNNEIISECYKKLVQNAIRIEGRIKFWRAAFGNTAIRERQPSYVTTAIAVYAINKCREVGTTSNFPSLINGELDDTLSFIVDESNWGNCTEAITVKREEKHDAIVVDYYTVAWIAKAMLSFDGYIDFSIIQKAINRIIDDYENGYWNYGGKNYIWTIYDALSTLDLYIIKK